MFCSLEFLQEKEHSIPLDDLGRDVASVAVLQRKHEAFENEASALGAQVRVKGIARTVHDGKGRYLLSSC